MSTTIHPEQWKLTPKVATWLNQSRGLIEVGQLEGLSLDPERRSNIAMLAGTIGVVLAAAPRDGEMTDSALEVYRNDFLAAKRLRLSHGLYIHRQDPRYHITDRLIKLVNQPCDLATTNRFAQHMGVVVGAGEFKTIARSAPDLAAHSRAVTRDANVDNFNREDVEERARRAAAHTLDSKLVALIGLDRLFSDQITVLGSLYRDARLVWRTSYLTKNLNTKRREGEAIIHDIVEVAANSLGYGTTATNASHRAAASNLYRRGSSKEIAQSWRGYTLWAGRYLEAKRIKVNQSQNACRRERAKYDAYLPQAA